MGAGELLREARTSLHAGDVEAAAASIAAALEVEDVPEAHQMMAALHVLDDRLEDACRERELAFRGFRDRGDLAPAARVAIDLAQLHEGLLGNRGAGLGWLERARRLLLKVGPCVEWGYFELAFIACYRDDVTALGAAADRALQISVEFADPDLEALALADGGLALVTSGRVADGFRRLDEAMVIVTAGEVRDPNTAGLSFCSMLSSCDLVGDLRRVDEWSRIIQRSVVEPLGGRPKVLHTHCLLAWGSVLSAAGRWDEAETVMLEAMGPSASRSAGHRAATSAHLAMMRIEQGRLEEATELLAPFEDQVVACRPLARLHLAKGEPELAMAVARRALRRLAGDALRAAPLLGVLVEAAVASGDVDAAEEVSADLDDLAVRAGAGWLAAEAALAAGRVHAARADHVTAVACFDRAAAGLVGDERPALCGEIELALARSLAASGDATRSVVEARAARAIFERLGSSTGVDRAAELLRSLGLPGRSRTSIDVKAIAGTLSAREIEVLDLLRQGLTNAEIGGRLYISSKTAEHHVSRILAKLGVRTRTEAAVVAASLSALGE